MVPNNGYHWWYIDALDESGQNGLVIIAFVGSVFSPYYYGKRQRGDANPEEFCAVNVGIYSGGRKQWSMTERKASALQRSRDQLAIGPSSLTWRDGELEIMLRERSAPLGRKVKGRVLLKPEIRSDLVFNLDGRGRHHWHPWCAQAAVEVDLVKPNRSWNGKAYMDSNWGSEPLEDGFSSWEWSRSHHGAEVLVDYNSNRIDGSKDSLSLAFSAEKGCRERSQVNAHPIRKTGWGISRSPCSEQSLSLVRTLEDTPFYARSLFQTAGSGNSNWLVHESLSLDRFRSPWVRLMLPFRMPRKFN